MSEEKNNSNDEPEKNHDHEGQTEETPYPPLLEYLQSKEGHELASRVVAILEDVKKATIESATETHKRNAGISKTFGCAFSLASSPSRFLLQPFGLGLQPK